MRIDRDCAKVPIGSVNGLMGHQYLHNQQRVDRRSLLGEPLETRQHPTSERRAQQMGKGLEPTRFTSAADRRLIGVLLYGCTAPVEEERTRGRATFTRRASQPSGAILGQIG